MCIENQTRVHGDVLGGNIELLTTVNVGIRNPLFYNPLQTQKRVFKCYLPSGERTAEYYKSQWCWGWVSKWILPKSLTLLLHPSFKNFFNMVDRKRISIIKGFIVMCVQFSWRGFYIVTASAAEWNQQKTCNARAIMKLNHGTLMLYANTVKV